MTVQPREADGHLVVFIQNLFVHLAEKILLMQPLTFGGITVGVWLQRKNLSALQLTFPFFSFRNIARTVRSATSSLPTSSAKLGGT
jgi:hypothetical protein